MARGSDARSTMRAMLSATRSLSRMGEGAIHASSLSGHPVGAGGCHSGWPSTLAIRSNSLGGGESAKARVSAMAKS